MGNGLVSRSPSLDTGSIFSAEPKNYALGSVLIIEKFSVAASVARKALNNLNVEVLTASQLRIGVQILLSRKNDIRLIFLDLVLSEIDGVECLSFIKLQPDIAHIPIYMISSFHDQTLKETCLKHGAEGMLLKPLSIITFRGVIDCHFNQFRSAKDSNYPHENSRKGRQFSLDDYLLIGDHAPAFKLLDSNFSEFSFPLLVPRLQKQTLLIFLPSIFNSVLYEGNGFFTIFSSFYHFLQSHDIFLLCISSDLPFALAGTAARNNFPILLLSDPSLSVAKRYIGVADFQSYNSLSSRGPGRSSVAGMLLVNQESQVLNKWIGDFHSEFPEDFSEWFRYRSERVDTLSEIITADEEKFLEDPAIFSRHFPTLVSTYYPAISNKIGSTILLIDASSISSKLSFSKLTRLGFSVDVTYNGKEGYEHLLKSKNKPYILIICDLIMPIVNGMEFLLLISKEEQFSNIPVVVQSQYENEKLTQYCKDLGCKYFLKKPIQQNELQSLLRNLSITN
jgi:CheY-like chemotaxis protein